jgi:hypothetical protein
LRCCRSAVGRSPQRVRLRSAFRRLTRRFAAMSGLCTGF